MNRRAIYSSAQSPFPSTQCVARSMPIESSHRTNTNINLPTTRLKQPRQLLILFLKCVNIIVILSVELLLLLLVPFVEKRADFVALNFTPDEPAGYPACHNFHNRAPKSLLVIGTAVVDLTFVRKYGSFCDGSKTKTPRLDCISHISNMRKNNYFSFQPSLDDDFPYRERTPYNKSIYTNIPHIGISSLQFFVLPIGIFLIHAIIPVCSALMSAIRMIVIVIVVTRRCFNIHYNEQNQCTE